MWLIETFENVLPENYYKIFADAGIDRDIAFLVNSLVYTI
jgi:hypothetical protein